MFFESYETKMLVNFLNSSLEMRKSNFIGDLFIVNICEHSDRVRAHFAVIPWNMFGTV